MKKLLLALLLLLAIAGIALAAVNINTASKDELMTLKGIGERRAQDIIDYRSKHGPFKSVDDLEKVPGIGPGIMKQIRPDVTVTGKTAIDKPAETKSKAGDSKAAKQSETKKAETAKGTATKTETKPAEKTEAKKADEKSAKSTAKKAETTDEKKIEKK